MARRGVPSTLADIPADEPQAQHMTLESLGETEEGINRRNARLMRKLDKLDEENMWWKRSFPMLSKYYYVWFK